MHGPPLMAVCGALVAPNRRCHHVLQDHVVHGNVLLECWRCEDWHEFKPIFRREGESDDQAAA